MQREFGGYLPLELPWAGAVHRRGRAAAELWPQCDCGCPARRGREKVYLPYYNCNTVYDAVTRAGFAVERYPLDARRLPVCPRWATASGCCMSTTSALRRTTCWPRSSAAAAGDF